MWRGDCSKMGDRSSVSTLNDYYDVDLKKARCAELAKFPAIRVCELDLADRRDTAALFERERFPFVVHLAAQAGVRCLLTDPQAYGDANLQGFSGIIKRAAGTTAADTCCSLLHLPPYMAPTPNCRSPCSRMWIIPSVFYAATKKANELMAHAYSHLFVFCQPQGFAFFTVYGPWGRPDMAMYIFTASAILRSGGRSVIQFRQYAARLSPTLTTRD